MRTRKRCDFKHLDFESQNKWRQVREKLFPIACFTSEGSVILGESMTLVIKDDFIVHLTPDTEIYFFFTEEGRLSKHACYMWQNGIFIELRDRREYPRHHEVTDVILVRDSKVHPLNFDRVILWTQLLEVE